MVRENTIRLVVLQDYRLLRSALVERINREVSMEVCGQSSCGEEARKLISLHKPHLVLMNISFRNARGFTLLRRLKKDFEELRILTFSCDPEFEHLHAELALHAGSDGYVSSADNEESLVQAIHYVMDGRVYLSAQIKRSPKRSTSEKIVFSNLSRREIEVFCLTGCGHVPKRIATKLNLSVKTIESYRDRIREKMGLNDGAELLYSATSFMRSAARRRTAWMNEGEGKEVLFSSLQQVELA